MQTLSPAGEAAVRAVAERHGFSEAAAVGMLDALVRGQGAMAQFDHADFGGPGQWMRGGMVMVSDLFDHGLKARVQALADELSALLSQSAKAPTGAPAPRGAGPQGAPAGDGGDGSGPAVRSPVSLFVPSAAGQAGPWWPEPLGSPTSTGSQNGVRYAWFPQERRLAIDLGGHVTVYDTGEHFIHGFAQQQSADGSLSFTSQNGPVKVPSLQIVPARSGEPAASPDHASRSGRGPSADDTVSMIERLAELRAKGVLTEEEFAAKKAELLARL